MKMSTNALSIIESHVNTIKDVKQIYVTSVFAFITSIRV